jgi:DnaJ-domain-containing protein 1
MPAAFLGQQMELREALENATRAKDVKSLDALQKSIARDKQALEEKLAQRIDADKDYQSAAGLVRELQFLEKLEAEIDGAYETLE